MIKRFFIIIIFYWGYSIYAQSPAPTPPMGWLSWNLFEGNISGSLIREIALAIDTSGLKDVGYEYIIIDDLWQGGRNENGKIIPDPVKFPEGIKPLADELHQMGLKLGIYTDAAEFTCGGKTGSWGYADEDIKQFAQWGIDYIKIDYCGAPPDLFSAIERYQKFGNAIKNSGRKMVFAICEWGQRSPWLWGHSVGGDLWRTTWDIRDIWEHGKYNSGHKGIMEALDRQVGLHRWAGPGKWNDPDMLLTGLYGKGNSASANRATGCSVIEYQSQMSLWCLLSAPLLACCDLRNMDSDTKRILSNREVIQINQDPLGKQGERFFKENEKEIWIKELSNHDYAVGFLNRNDSIYAEFIFDAAQLGFQASSIIVRDLWAHKNIETKGTVFPVTAAPHEVKLYRISR